jgi:hypothetical protein
VSTTSVVRAALQGLYGPPAASLEEAAGRGAVTPPRLKQAFAGPLTAPGRDLLELDELPELEAALLAEACAFRRGAPLGALLADREPAAATAAIQHLTRRFLVELPAPDLVSVHDLVREAVAASARPPTAGVHARCLRHYRAQAARDPADDTLELEILHHAVASGADDVAVELLLRYVPHRRRMFTASAVAERELADAADVLSRRRALPAALRLLRVRIRARQGQLAEAYAEAAAAADEPLAELDRAEMAYCLGRFAGAAAHARRAAADARLGPGARLWALMIVIDAARCGGAIARARRQLAGAAPHFAQAGAVGEASRSWLSTMLAFDREDYAAAHSPPPPAVPAAAAPPQAPPPPVVPPAEGPGRAAPPTMQLPGAVPARDLDREEPKREHPLPPPQPETP